MKLLSATLLAISMFSIARADSWAFPKPRSFLSESGQYVLRIIPGKSAENSKAIAIIFELNSEGDKYIKKKEFPLVNHLSPADAIISDKGEVFTFDDWGNAGYRHVVVYYSVDGKIKADYTLQQLFPAKQFKELCDNHSTVSSVWWRGGVPRFDDSLSVIIDDALGGCIAIANNGKVEYFPPKKE